MELVLCNTEDKIAYALTKSLKHFRFENLRDLLRLRCVHSLIRREC